MVDSGISAFVSRHYGVAPGAVAVNVAPLRGGLCSTVTRVRVRFTDPARVPRTAAFVVKAVSGREMREVFAYESLIGRLELPVAPRLLASERLSDGSGRLFLEWVQSWRRWPWADEELVRLVLDRLAYIHQVVPQDAFRDQLREWEYEVELQRSAEDTLSYFELVLTDPQHGALKRLLAPMRRVVSSLANLRRSLLSRGASIIHGDAHTGNVMVKLRGKRRLPVVLDWARVRLGSPLEDVNCWLQSLGFWEDQAHRRHDTLVRHYLAARGFSGPVGGETRDAYAVARASNALAGAMKYHLVNMTNPDHPEWLRAQSVAYVRDWGRGIARAAAASRG